jgi:glycosyltransferase involved in cell wall biosynthesis
VRPLTILHLAANRWWTGSADPVIRLVVGLNKRGHRALLGVIRGDRFEAKAREAGLELVDGLSLESRFAPLAVLRDIARLRELVRRAAVDVIHSHHSHDHWLAWLASGSPGRLRAHRIAVVRTFHNRRAVRRDAVSQWLYRRTSASFVVSRAIESRCREVRIPSDRTFWVPGAADLARFSPFEDGRAVREELGLGEAPVVVSVARLAPSRRHDLLLSGFRQLVQELPDAKLLLVGKGESRADLETMVAQLGLGDRVTFTGYRDDDLPAVVGAGDCFALMRAGSDESCRAALEAMAAGRPVVAGRAGALPETVVHGETGLLLDDDRPETIARALGTVLRDRVRGREMGLAGRRRAEDVFDPERAIDTVERVYRELT